MLTNITKSLLRTLCRFSTSFKNSRFLCVVCNETVHRIPYYFSGSDSDAVLLVKESFKVYENFVSEDEELELMKEIEPTFRRRRYEFDHWDGAIQGYKETEKSEWNIGNEIILQRLRNLAFPLHTAQIREVHVLDLAKNGFIKPHIDSIRFCGDTIAGISLLSSAVMRLVMEKNKSVFVDVLLPRRSLYIMK
ncbi:putative alpha-ketoglutarate-dependent dioxygenase ABH7, partial [Stegodyphus mimosarum]